MVTCNLDILKFINKKSTALPDIIDYKPYGYSETNKEIDVLEEYRRDLSRLGTYLENQEYKIVCPVTAFLSSRDIGGTYGIPTTVEGVPEGAFLPFSEDKSDMRVMTLTTAEILELGLKGYPFKLKKYTDVGRLYSNLKKFIDGYEDMLETSYNRITIAEDIVNEAREICDILYSKYKSSIEYDAVVERERYMNGLKNSKNILDILNYSTMRGIIKSGLEDNDRKEERDKEIEDRLNEEYGGGVFV